MRVQSGQALSEPKLTRYNPLLVIDTVILSGQHDRHDVDREGATGHDR